MGRKTEIDPTVRASVELSIAGNRPIFKSDRRVERGEVRRALWAIVRDEVRDAATRAGLELTVVGRRATTILEADGPLQAGQWFHNLIHHGRLPTPTEVAALALTLGIDECEIDAHLRLAPWAFDTRPNGDRDAPKHRTCESGPQKSATASATALEDESATGVNEDPDHSPTPFRTADGSWSAMALVSAALQHPLDAWTLRRRAFDLHTAAMAIDLLADREEEWKTEDDLK